MLYFGLLWWSWGWNLPANVGNGRWIHGPRRFHMLRSNKVCITSEAHKPRAHALQQEKGRKEAATIRSRCTAAREQLLLTATRERSQRQCRPGTTKNKQE